MSLDRDGLFDELLQYHYGCHENPDAIERLLASDATARDLMREVKQTAELLGSAARSPAPDVDWGASNGGRPSASPGALRSIGRHWRKIGLVAAALLFAAPPLRYLYYDYQFRSQRDHLFRLVVSGPPSSTDGTSVQYHVETWNHDASARAATLTWRFVGEDGEERVGGEIESDGSTDVVIPAHLNQTGTFEVTATADGDRQEATLELHGGRAAPLAHLSVDKPVYRPGERIRMRGLLLDRRTLTPRPGNYRVELKDAKGAKAQNWFLPAVDGVIAMEYDLPESASGGRYSVELRDNADQIVVDSIEFLVRRFQPPRLKKEIVLDRKSYAPGESGRAVVTVSRIAGGAAFGATVSGELIVDGESTWSEEILLGDDGAGAFTFRVPNEVERGEARFVARVEDRGVVESEVKPFVIPTGHLIASLYPEGGDLVDGVDNRVYVEVVDPLDRPASARGRVVDDRGRTITSFVTEHQGRGRFDFTPTAEVAYRVELDDTKSAPIPLPTSRGDALIHARLDSFGAGNPIEITVESRGEGPWLLAAFSRGDLVASNTFRSGGQQDVALRLPDDVGGVLRVTLFNERLEPVAERLVHRAPSQQVEIVATVDEPIVTPGAAQKVALETRDETGAPVAAIVGVTVTDRAVADLVGEHRVGLADQTWLLADVDDLEDVGEFLIGDAAPRNVDLLLGTRGWRRFAWAEPKAFVAAHGDAGKRLLLNESFATTPNLVDTAANNNPKIRQARFLASKSGRQAKSATILLGILAIAIFLTVAAGSLGARLLPAVRHVRIAAGGVMLSLLVLTGIFFVHRVGTYTDRMPVAEMAGVMADRFLDGKNAQDEIEEELELGANEDAFGVWMRQLGYAGADDDVHLEKPAGEAKAPLADLAAAPPAEAPAPEAELLRAAAEDDDGFAKKRVAFRTQNDVKERVYAHRSARSDATRRDFTETVYWKPYLLTDANGHAEFSFDVSDSITTWSVVADAHGAGRVGQSNAEFIARIPFRIESVLPYQLTEGDRVELPIAALCDDSEITTARLKGSVRGGLRVIGDASTSVDLSSGGARWYLPIEVDQVAPDNFIEIVGDATRWGDRVERSLEIVPRGFPRVESSAGRASDDRPETIVVMLPDEWRDGSLTTTLKLYTSPLDGLLDGMGGMLQEPCGCFEQASSSNYPNLLALSLMEAAGGDDPSFEARARDLLAKGYARISSYECSDRGYEWFGANPGHEALTAYGLLEFTDMAQVHDVDLSMVERTRNWLLARRDGNGGYQRNSRSLDSFGGAPAEVTDAYVTFALTSTSKETSDLTVEIDRAASRAIESSDPYEVALVAATLQAAGRLEEADAARERLKRWQRDDGGLVGATTSITSSRGANYEVETTSLAILAWLDDGDDAPAVDRAIRFLQSKRQGSGRFGATQATILALRAFTAYAIANRTVASDSTIRVSVNGMQVASQTMLAGDHGPIEIAGIARHLRPGRNEVTLLLDGASNFPYALDVGYFSELPPNHPDASVSIDTTLAAESVAEGSFISLQVSVKNETDRGLPMTMAIVGIPASLDVDTRILDDLVKGGRFDLWELRGRELILYWRGLAPAETKDVHVDLLARIPGSTTGPASRAYLYYTDDQKRFAEPLRITVTRK